MKTANTIENKAKFFAQYFEQEVWRCSLHETIMKVDYDVLFHSYDTDQWLELTPLSDISEVTYQQARELLLLDGNDFTGLADNEIADWCNQYLYELSKDLNDPEYNCKIATIDKVRSMGFALPWMDLTIEDLQNYGWVKLKNK